MYEKSVDLMKEATLGRHAVRRYLRKSLSDEDTRMLVGETIRLNKISGLDFRLILNEPKAFRGSISNIARFANVRNYIAVVRPSTRTAYENVGYFGEQLVLKAHAKGLNTCWVGGTFKRIPGVIGTKNGQEICCVIAIGYGKNSGKPHKSKPYEAVTRGSGHPKWFKDGVDCALLAPTAFNSQNFCFELSGDGLVSVYAPEKKYDQISLGIVKLHFELGSGRKLQIG